MKSLALLCASLFSAALADEQVMPPCDAVVVQLLSMPVAPMLFAGGILLYRSESAEVTLIPHDRNALTLRRNPLSSSNYLGLCAMQTATYGIFYSAARVSL